MTPLPLPLETGDLVFWRLDQTRFAEQWHSGEGSYRAGGRWNSRGVRAVYAALDPATAILEVAVHKTFATLDIVPHVLTWARITDTSQTHTVDAAHIPNANWLRPGAPSSGQQAFGDALLKEHPFVLIPSVVSVYSWTVVFDPAAARDSYDAVAQERFEIACITADDPIVADDAAVVTARPEPRLNYGEPPSAQMAMVEREGTKKWT